MKVYSLFQTDYSFKSNPWVQPVYTIVELLKYRARQKPDRIAFTFLDNGDREAASLTYRQLDESARRIAAVLQQSAAMGDRALLLYPPGLDFISAFLGCLYAGIVAVPAYPPKQNRSMLRLQAIVDGADARLALTTEATLAGLSKRAAGQPRLGQLRFLATDRMADTRAEAWIEPSIDAKTLAFLQYTSGSTDDPKGVMVTHGNLLYNSEMVRVSFGHDDSTIFAGWLPLFHDMGLIGDVVQPLYLGIRSILMEPAAFIQKPVRWLQAISTYRATTSGAPNSAYELCIRKITEEQKSSLDLSSWTVAFNGAEPVRADTVERFAEAFRSCGFRPEAMYPTYGLAEATLFVTGGTRGQLPVIESFDSAALERGRAIAPQPEAGARRLAGNGRTCLDQQVLIVNPETLRPCRDGEVGEIWIAGQNVAGGYWNSPERTERTFGARTMDGAGPFLRTGDLGFMRDASLYVAGRIKDVIIVRGRNHYPQDIERTVEESHPAIVPNATAAFSIEMDGEERVAVVCEIRRECLRSLAVDDVVASIRQAVAEEHELQLYAATLLKTASIPRTSSGKIQRLRCRTAFLSGEGLEAIGEWRLPRGGAVAAPPSASAADIRTWLIRRMAGKLGIAERLVDAGEPFSRYGMDSVDAVAISGELETWLGRQLPPTLVYDFPNIDALARHLAGAGVDSSHVAPALDGHAIAVVGVGCRFPGADNPGEFWRLLRDGVDAVTAALPSRWAAVPSGNVPVWAGLLKRVDGFDADFFGINDREAEMMDPQQRLLLEVVWEALEHAGQPPRALAGSRTGVFVGISHSDYVRLQNNRASETDPYSATGSALSVAANRISYFLDLRGPSWAVDTACSSSLVAVHQACQSLLRGECDLAITAGVNLILTPQLSTAFARAGMLAPDGRCKTFDAAADGYVRGEGAGAVVLKRLAAAERDGDRVLAVIRGSAVNQDGRSNGLTAPNGPAQQAVIGGALRDAGVRPAEIGYLEAHGTGTPLGDVIEMDSLKAVLDEGRSAGATCWVGSVKTNVGHLEAAAGICGLIKTVLALRSGTIPPHLHLKKLNPKIALDNSSLQIPTSCQPWPTGERRLAGVSSFGFGGTNAHIVLEAVPAVAEARPAADRPAHILALSAKTPDALRELTQAWAGFLETHPETSLPDATFTAAAGRSHFEYRAAVAAGSVAELRAKLAGVCAGKIAPRAPRIAFLFTGQGSQHAGMGRVLFETQPSFRKTLERCDAVLRPHLDKPLLEVLYPPAGAVSSLDETAFSQPALFALEYALAELWRSWGIVPAAVMGHSVGEYAAACVAGVFTLEEGLRLVAERARLMQALPKEGTMMSVFAEEAQVVRAVEPHSVRVSVAAINGPRHVVISGETAAVEGIAADFRSRGVASRRLTVSHAFHSPLMRPMVEDFGRLAAGIAYRPPGVDILSNLSGTRDGNDMKRPDYWTRHVVSPVRFRDGMAALGQMDLDVFLEIGPKPTLTAMGRECLDSGQTWLPSLVAGKNDWTTMLESLASLYTRGAAVDWQGFDRDYSRRRIAVPTYPFQRQRYWLDDDGAPAEESARHPLLGRRLPEMAHAAGTHVWETRLNGSALAFLQGHRVMGSPVLPYSAYVEMALAAMAETTHRGPHRIVNLELLHPVFLRDAPMVQVVLGPQQNGDFSFRVYHRAGESNASNSEWILCASAGIEIAGERRDGEVRTDVLCQQ